MERMMLTDDERAYYESRAEQELMMATVAVNRDACASHYGLADLYLELAFGAGQAGPSESETR